METIERDFTPKGVKFYYVYKTLAHPEWDGYVTPFTLEERLAHIAEAKRTLKTRWTWLCDAMDNRLKKAFGSRPNSEFIVGADGVIISARHWCDATALRADLNKLVGPIDHPTTVEDLEFVYDPPPAVAAHGIVPRLKKTRGMVPLNISADFSKANEPWYAKLRAEATPALLRTGSGPLYIGFRLDPIYRVHWNNLTTDAIRVKIEAPEGVTLSQSVLTGPRIDTPADIDPREFMVDVSGADKTTRLTVTASYFACNDEQGWCKPIEQRYTVMMSGNRESFWIFPTDVNQAFNDRLGRSEGRAVTSELVHVESRLPGAPSPEMVKRANNRAAQDRRSNNER